MPVQVLVSYPRKEGMRFDMSYYLNTHMSLVSQHWRPYGLQSWSVVQFPDTDPSGLHCQTTLVWPSREHFEKAWEADIPELMGDLENYSDVVPVRWVGEILGRG